MASNSSSASGGYQLSINMDEVKRWAATIDDEAAHIVQLYTNRALKNSAVIVEQREHKETPKGVTDGLNKSIKQFVTEEAATIGPDHGLKYALYVEKGTKPHMPPVDAITAWAESKGINPWALAKSIAQKGTKSNPFVKRTFKATKDDVKAEFVIAIKLITRSLAKAGKI